MFRVGIKICGDLGITSGDRIAIVGIRVMWLRQGPSTWQDCGEIGLEFKGKGWYSDPESLRRIGHMMNTGLGRTGMYFGV